MARIAIAGFGKEGKSLLNYLTHSPQYTGAEIWILDKDIQKRKELSVTNAKKIHWQLGPGYLKNLDQFHIIFRSPGIPFELPEFREARKKRIFFSSATQIFFDELEQFSRKPLVIGVTGSKGKGTTCALLAHILRQANKSVVLAGNIGESMLDTLIEAERADIVILELSSFQLQDVYCVPDIAIILDVFPEHLDAHRTSEEYYNAKASLVKNQKTEGVVFYFKNNKLTRAIAEQGLAKKIPIVPKEKNVRKNFEMARMIAKYLKLSDTFIDQTMLTFRGLPHRLELVRFIEHKKNHSHIRANMGMSFYDDSAATNPEAAAAAVRSFALSPLYLLAGGKDKKLEYVPLAQALKERKKITTEVFLYGENSAKIATALKPCKNIKISILNDLSFALHSAYESATSELINSSTQESRRSLKERSGSRHLQVGASGLINSPIILLSPASASFDQFANYYARGGAFKKLVKKLK